MKKFFVFVMILVFSLCLLTACGASSLIDETKNSPSKTTKNQTPKIPSGLESSYNSCKQNGKLVHFTNIPAAVNYECYELISSDGANNIYTANLYDTSIGVSYNFIFYCPKKYEIPTPEHQAFIGFRKYDETKENYYTADEVQAYDSFAVERAENADGSVSWTIIDNGQASIADTINKVLSK